MVEPCIHMAEKGQKPVTYADIIQGVGLPARTDVEIDCERWTDPIRGRGAFVISQPVRSLVFPIEPEKGLAEVRAEFEQFMAELSVAQRCDACGRNLPIVDGVCRDCALNELAECEWYTVPDRF